MRGASAERGGSFLLPRRVQSARGIDDYASESVATATLVSRGEEHHRQKQHLGFHYFQVNVATAPAGNELVKVRPLSTTLNDCVLEAPLSTNNTRVPSGLTNATSSTLPEPKLFESTR